MGESSEPLSLVWNLSVGTDEVTTGPEHPLLAPVRLAIESGQSPGKCLWFSVQESLEAVPIVVGSFVLTPKGKLLFFPGGEVRVATDNQSPRFQGSRLDHVTLDEKREEAKESSHLAVFDLTSEKSRGSRKRTKTAPGHMHIWFSLLLPTLDGLIPVPKTLKVDFPPPRKDPKAFANDLMHQLSFARTAILPPASPNGPTFFQFDFWVGRGREWKSLLVRPMAWAYIPAIVSGAPAMRQDIEVCRGDFEIESDLGVSILISRPQGQLALAQILRPALDHSALAKLPRGDGKE